MTVYPVVIGEAMTLEMVAQGASLARYGDGELAMACRGVGIRTQMADSHLSARLRGILHDSGECLVGIPNIRSETPKFGYWRKYLAFDRYLSARPYVSAFVTRPDSAPWIDTPKYWARLESLWVGQDVTLVRGSETSLTASDLVGATKVTEILAPSSHAWSQYHTLIDKIGRPSRVLLCLGPTATVLAVDLCAQGVHAIDLGHVGLFWRKHLRGEPLIRTEADKVA